MPARAASAVSHASAATGAPANAGSLWKIGLRPCLTSASAGESTASTPGTARAASTSSSTVACACGERTITPCSMPGSATSET